MALLLLTVVYSGSQLRLSRSKDGATSCGLRVLAGKLIGRLSFLKRYGIQLWKPVMEASYGLRAV